MRNLPDGICTAWLKQTCRSHFCGRHFTGGNVWSHVYIISTCALKVIKVLSWASRVAPVIKNSPANRRHKTSGFDPWVRMIPWRRKWQPTSVFWPGESQGQRSPEGYSPWGHIESDTTERLSMSTKFYIRDDFLSVFCF